MYFKLSFVLITLLVIATKSQDSNDIVEEEIPVVEGDGGPVTIKVEEDVYVLTGDNFDLIVLSKPIILVEFYAEWCGHCKALAPEYAKAAKELKESAIPLAKIDANKEEAIAQRYGVTGFPTLFVFRNGTQEEYTGGRTAQSIIDYMRERADPNWKPPPESVLSLTEANFDEIVAKEDIILVEWYAPWCGHCKRLAPEYERAAKQLEPLGIKLAKVDATVETELAKRFDVTGYPKLLVFRKGKKYQYKGPREESGIISYMKEQLISPTIEISSAEKLKKSLNPEWPTIVGFFDSQTNPMFDVFVDTAFEERERSFKFYHTFDQKVIKELKEKSNTIVLFAAEFFSSEFEPSRYRLPLNENRRVEEISWFIGNNSLPLVGQRKPSSHWLYHQKFPLVVVYYDIDLSFEHRKQTQITRKQVLQVANQYKGIITFCVAKEDDYTEELHDLKLDDSGEDVNVGYFESPKVRYAMPPTDDFNAEELKSFVEDVLNGRIKRTIKSQPIPARNDGPVVTVVGDTFETLVTKSNKNVLIEFYANWCGHCKQLEPIYKQLANRFGDNRELVVAKIEATLNDFPDLYEVNGFPTIYFLAKDDKSKPHLYLGDRSLEDLTKYVDSMLANDNDKRREEL